MQILRNVMVVFIITIMSNQLDLVYAQSEIPIYFEVRNVITENSNIIIENKNENQLNMNNVLTLYYSNDCDIKECLYKQLEMFNKKIENINSLKIITANRKLTKEDLYFIGNLNIENIDLSCAKVENNLIPKDCFYKNKSLKNFKFPKNLEIIEDYAFAECSNLQGKLILPETLKSIGIASFAGCGYDSFELPLSITEIPISFCNRWYNLKDVEIQPHITKINDYAFIGTNITSLKINNYNNLILGNDIFGD